MKPILFNTDMVRAIQSSAKTVTRRLVKPHYRNGEAGFRVVTNKHTGQYIRIEIFDEWGSGTRWLNEPYRPGDILYVRETWQYAYDLDGNDQPIEGTGRYLYAADNLPEPFAFWVNPNGTHRDSMPWRPSIHMPHEAARIFLRVTDVWVERLQEITEEQAIAEGFEPVICDHPCGYTCTDCMNTGYLEPAMLGFVEEWDNILKPADRALYGWDANPWVWVIEFERISKPEEI